MSAGTWLHFTPRSVLNLVLAWNIFGTSLEPVWLVLRRWKNRKLMPSPALAPNQPWNALVHSSISYKELQVHIVLTLTPSVHQIFIFQYQ